MKMDLSHFASRANEAAFWEAWVGAVLARCGLYTLHHPFTVAKHMGEVANYFQSWDMDVVHGPYFNEEGSIHGRTTRVEVKSKNEDFTSPEDYPYSTAIVCSATSHRRKYKSL